VNDSETTSEGETADTAQASPDRAMSGQTDSQRTGGMAEGFELGFADLGLSEPLLRAVEESGYTTPTPIQRKAIPNVLLGNDLIGLAQTGTGKTAGFTLPMLDMLQVGRARARMPRSLILEPTRELAQQVANSFDRYGKYVKLSKALLIGGESMTEQERVLNRGVDVLIATPGRLIDLFERGNVILTDSRLLVIGPRAGGWAVGDGRDTGQFGVVVTAVVVVPLEGEGDEDLFAHQRLGQLDFIVCVGVASILHDLEQAIDVLIEPVRVAVVVGHVGLVVAAAVVVVALQLVDDLHVRPFAIFRVRILGILVDGGHVLAGLDVVGAATLVGTADVGACGIVVAVA